MKSWKIGAVAGLISGIVLGIIYSSFANFGASMSLYEPWWLPIVTNNIVINIPLFGFWGIILGIIFSKVYNIIPRKGLLKGLVYGLFLYFIISFRIETYDLAYGHLLNAVGGNFTGFFSWLSYGLVLGIIYESLHEKYRVPKEKKKIIQYDMESGILPGAIAGFLGGMAASISQVIGHATGYWGVPVGGQIISTVDIWMSQVGTHILINMMWGTIFGAFFAKVYNLVPGKKIKKGFYYGLTMFLITTFLVGTWLVIWPMFHNEWEIATYFAGATWITGGANAILFGLILGLLYRKPTK